MMWYGGPWFWNTGWFGIGGIGMMIIGLLSFVLFVVGFLYILKWLFNVPTHEKGRSARYDDKEYLEILKNRYANGEISKEEYEKMKRDLG